MAAWRIPLSDVDLDAAEEEAVLRVVRSGWLTLGAEVAAFEREFATLCGARDAVAVANCTAALHLACMALGVQPGVEVIVPTMTFVATANAVVLAGGRPVLADSVGDGDLSIDPADVQRRITPATKGIICVHYGGSACQLDELLALCERHGLFLIEDAAHAPGGQWDGRPLGTFGDVGCFSFFGNKNMTTGEGGMTVARDEAVLGRIRLLRSHGMTTTSWDRFRGHAFDYDVVASGLNYRPTELAAAIGLAQLMKLPANNARRRVLLDRYRERLSALAGVEPASMREGGTSHLAVAIARDSDTRDRIRAALTEARIQTSLHYPPIHLFGQFRSSYGYAPGDLPVAEDLAARILTLPLYSRMTVPQVDKVCDAIEASLAGDPAAPALGAQPSHPHA